MLWVVLLLARVLVARAAYFGNYNCVDNRDAMVHLFEWKWSNIADECERFLGPKGFCGVQISPPAEHRVIVTSDRFHPWYQRYQPVSYKFGSRSGNEDALRDMVSRCNNAGVRIYADIIINHMTGGGSGTGSDGSSFNGDTKDFPGVPYGSGDFNHNGPGGACTTGSGEIEDYNDANQVRNCMLSGLRDLMQGKDYVRGKMIDLLNRLADMGVAGFRMDACKHMWPNDLQGIYDALHDLPTQWFPSGTKPYVIQEVIDQGTEPIKADHYTHLGRVTEFRYGLKLGEVIRKWNGQKLAYLKNFGEGWGFISGGSSVVFVDNHDNQRGHGGGGAVITHKEGRLYKMANAYELAWNYGHVRLMSSYSFNVHHQGPPSDGNGNTNDVPINPDGSCSGGWMCEHRWRQITNMVGFHNVALGQPVSNWWDNGEQAIAFGRGDRAFIVINNEDSNLNVNLGTGLSQGNYCDVISGGLEDGQCTGKTIFVDGGGQANFDIAPGNDGDSHYDSIIAIHVDAKL